MKLLFVLVLLLNVACTSSPTAPDRVSGGPGTFQVSGNYNGRVTQLVAVSGVALTRAPLRIEFTGNYAWRDAQGTLKAPTDPHVLTRSDIGGIPTNDGGAAFESYLNQTWFPSQLRDDTGARTGFACIDILSFSPTDVNWSLTISDNPIPYNGTCGQA